MPETHTVSEHLSSFEPIGLSEMDSVALMDRTDTKYIFNRNLLAELLPELAMHYHVLEVNGIRVSPYETLYFDTKDFNLYLHHHNSKPTRLKIRCRKYVSTGTVFFEIKFRNSKGRTIKQRIEQPGIEESIQPAAGEFILQHTRYVPEDFEAKLWVNYSRVTLVSKGMTERVTLDLDLRYKNGTYDSSLSEVVIAEVKGEKHHPSFFNSLMKSRHIRSGSISKYCIGIARAFEDLKANNFKRQLLFLNKLSDDILTVS